jgi:hypothetical protein
MKGGRGAPEEGIGRGAAPEEDLVRGLRRKRPEEGTGTPFIKYKIL